MQASQIPTKFQIPFGNAAAAGTIRSVPVADQTAVSPGAASLTTGFPVATGQPLASGGIPPSMQDFNGLFNQVTAWNRWQCLGGTVSYDAAFSTAIGGYPKGAVLQSSTAGNLWLSVVDNNTSNPDGASPTGWVPLITAAAPAGKGLFSSQTAGSGSWTVPAGVYYVYGTCVGAGAGGSGTSTAGTQSSAGGGAGGTAAGWMAVTPGQSISYVVGAGSPGVGYGQNSANGGTSSIGSTMQATGGYGVGNGGVAGGAGGIGTGGQVNIAGGCGNDAYGGSAAYPGGFGGTSSLGGGGRTGYIGVDGYAPGSGGGGGYTTTYTHNGGNGRDGYVSFQY